MAKVILIKERFRHLIGQVYAGIVITEKFVNQAYTRSFGIKSTMNNNLDLDDKQIDALITDNDILRLIPSVANISMDKNGSPKIKDADIRMMEIGNDAYVGMTEAEKQFIITRTKQYEADYALEKAGDYSVLRRIVILEMQLHQLDIKMINDPVKYEFYLKQTDTLNAMLIKNLDSIYALKKNRESGKKKTDQTVGNISDTLSQMDKSIQELEAEEGISLNDAQEKIKQIKRRS